MQLGDLKTARPVGQFDTLKDDRSDRAAHLGEDTHLLRDIRETRLTACTHTLSTAGLGSHCFAR